MFYCTVTAYKTIILTDQSCILNKGNKLRENVCTVIQICKKKQVTVGLIIIKYKQKIIKIIIVFCYVIRM